MNSHKYLALVRREFHEHRSLWMTPVVAAGFLLLGAIFGAIHVGRGSSFDAGPEFSGEATRSIGGISLLGVTIFLGIFTTMVAFSYLLDSLYSERKDRSILFWKSLPVSDTETVLSKLAVGLVIVPLIALAIALVLQPLLAGIAWLRHEQFRPLISTHLLLGSVTAVPKMLVTLLFTMLWYAPLSAYLMLASVLAKRTPLMYAALPPVVLSIAEKLTLDTSYVIAFVKDRIFPWSSRMGGVIGAGSNGWKTLGGRWWELFQDPALWLGLAAAAGMLYIVIRLRRYRDDT